MFLEIGGLSDLQLPGFNAMLKSSREEGFRFLVRLRKEFESGENRFRNPGEGLWGAFALGQLIGIVGLNRFPEAPEEGRVRRLYVAPDRRGQGVGRVLMREVVSSARPWAKRLVLRTDDPHAAAFYCRLGFQAVDHIAGVSHVFDL